MVSFKMILFQTCGQSLSKEFQCNHMAREYFVLLIQITDLTATHLLPLLLDEYGV